MSFSCLAQLLLLRQLSMLAKTATLRLPRGIIRGKLALLMILLVIGLISIPLGNFLPDKKPLQNIVEWNFALLMSSYYLITGYAWRYTGFAAKLILRK